MECDDVCVRLRCKSKCTRGYAHLGRCACSAHAADPLGAAVGAPAEPQSAQEETFASLVEWAETRGGPAVALRLYQSELGSLRAVRTAKPEQPTGPDDTLCSQCFKLACASASAAQGQSSCEESSEADEEEA